MSNEGDNAHLAEEHDRMVALAKHASRAGQEPQVPVTGFCHNCGEPLAAGLRWCPDDPPTDGPSACYQDWAKLVNRQRPAR